jgi:hypothetical protein
MARQNGAHLRAAVERELATRLALDGWVAALPAWGSPISLAAFVRSVSADIAATVQVMGGGVSFPARLPIVIRNVQVGVCYEPLRRLWPLLGVRYHLTLLADPPDGREEVEEREWQLAVENADQVRLAVDEVVADVSPRAVVFAQGYPGVDELLAAFRSGSDPGWVRQEEVALLAAAGRFEEARDALERYRPLTGYPEGDREARLFIHHVGRYIDSGGNPAIVPSEPPPSQFAPPEPRPPISEIWREQRARQQALEAVSKLDRGTGRAELRAALERELSARGVTESPLWYERALDNLHQSDAQRSQQFAKRLVSASRLAVKVVRWLRDPDSQIPDRSLPDWLELPDRAAYPVAQRTGANWTQVRLDDGIASWLDRAYAAIPRLFGVTAHVDAWLDADGDKIVVGIGQTRVGSLDAKASHAYEPILKTAGERDELPYTRARFTPRPAPDQYLLELPLPPEPTTEPARPHA